MRGGETLSWIFLSCVSFFLLEKKKKFPEKKTPLTNLSWLRRGALGGHLLSPLSCSWISLEGNGPQDFTLERESLQLKLGGSRASGFLVRLILENIPHPLPHPGYGGLLGLVAPRVILVTKYSGGPQALPFPKDFHMPHLVYSTESQGEHTIFISQVRKQRLTEEESRPLRWLKLVNHGFRYCTSLNSWSEKESCFHFAAEEIEGLESNSNLPKVPKLGSRGTWHKLKASDTQPSPLGQSWVL